MNVEYARVFNLKSQLILTVLVLAASLALRLYGLNVFLTADEFKWTCRSINFRTALSRGDLASTFQVGHPGVIVMWAGALGMGREIGADWIEACEDTTRTDKLLDQLGSQRLSELAQFTFSARRVVAILNWLCVVATVLLASRLWGSTVALFTAVLLGFDPFYLALSRVFHLDALAASFMLVSLLALLASMRTDERRTTRDQRPPAFVVGHWSLVVSGLIAGLAFLTKSPALFLGPFAVGVIGLGLFQGRRLSDVARDVVTWCVAAGLTCVVLWPATWVDPFGTVAGVLTKALNYAEEGHSNPTFFMGQVVGDPGAAFYPVAWAFRTTPLVWLGLLAVLLVGALRGFRRAKGTPRPVTLSLLVLFGLLFGVFMTMGAKKFDRYLIPSFLVLDVAAAVGLAKIGERAARIRDQDALSKSWKLARNRTEPVTSGSWLLSSGFCTVLVLVQAALILPYWPYFFTYYNPLLGGPARARDVLFMGRGEGLDLAAAYLNTKADPSRLQVAVGNKTAFAPFFAGEVSVVEGYDPSWTDYFIFYISQTQRNLNPDLTARYFGKRQPEYVVQLNGVDYAWIFANADSEEPLAYLTSQANPTQDVILADTSSILDRQYRGQTPFHVISSRDEAAVVDTLQRVTAGRRRIWYLTYPHEGKPGPLDYQLTSHAFPVSRKDFPDLVTMTTYELPATPGFRALTADQPVELNFGSQLRLQGYSFATDSAQWGRGFGLGLQWQAITRPGANYAVFLHLVDEAGHLWGQGDKVIVDEQGQWPTSTWDPGEQHLDRCLLTLLPGTPPGRYQLKMGIYNPETGQRLAFVEEATGQRGTEYTLGEIRVAASPHVPDLAELGVPQPETHELAGRLRLLGYGLSGGVVKTGENLTVSLFWESLAHLPQDYRLRLTLVSTGGSTLAETVQPVVNPDHPTSQWQPGERLRSQQDLPVPVDAPGGQSQLVVQLLDGAGQPVATPWLLGKVRVEAVARSFTIPADIQHPLRASLGDSVSLLGYSVQPDPVRPGETLKLALYWQARRTMTTSYTVFTHVLDASGQLLAQRDSVPQDGARPTTTWAGGEVLVDNYQIPLGADLAAGSYRLTIGMYDPATLERLPAYDAGGQRLADDRVFLGSVNVER
jgi:4-amino-4-deoxy-L-arabinose transferase-like glycosyltransferase